MPGNSKRYLVLMRHAKALPHNFHTNDRERKLSEEGEKQAKLSAEYLVTINFIPQLIITSSASRALQTAKIVSEILNLSNNIIITNDELYYGDIDAYFYQIYKVDNNVKKLMLVGHNPVIAMLAAMLTDYSINKMKTASLLGLEMFSDTWADFDQKTKKITFLFTP